MRIGWNRSLAVLFALFLAFMWATVFAQALVEGDVREAVLVGVLGPVVGMAGLMGAGAVYHDKRGAAILVRVFAAICDPIFTVYGLTFLVAPTHLGKVCIVVLPIVVFALGVYATFKAVRAYNVSKLSTMPVADGPSPRTEADPTSDTESLEER
jgi:hypothetical protein